MHVMKGEDDEEQDEKQIIGRKDKGACPDPFWSGM